MKLRCLADGDDRVVTLKGNEVRIGRGSDNDVVLADYSVSRKHAAVRREGGAWFVYDLMSTNGVQVNRVTVKKAPLKDADRLKIGIFEFAVEGETTASGSPPASAAMPPPPGAHPGASISSATIIRRLSDFSADYGLEPQPVPRESAVRQSKRRVLEQAYANKLFGYLTRLARLLINAVSVDEVLQKVMEIAFEALPVDRGFMLLTDEATGETVCELARFSDRVELRPDADAPISKTMLETVMRERVALLTYDALADQRLVGGDSIRIHQIRSAMCAPLWSGEKIIGVMQVDSPFHAGTFNEDDLDLLTALSNYAAVAVERIRYGLRAEYDRQVRSRLERYHSPAVIEAVISEGESGEEVRHLKNAEATVLFADLVGFTALAEQLDPQAVAELLGGYFTHSAEAIFAEGGTLDKFIGDCVMAFFGAPVKEEDHALRGVRAAARIQQAVKGWNAERQGKDLPLVRCRIGVNSGPVVVGDVGSNRRVDYTVLGNTVNVASRLEAIVAGPGDIAIGKTTFDLLAGAVPVEPLGEIQLKGLKRPVPTYRVLWEVFLGGEEGG
jgi:adenylate cyclase